MAWWQAVVLGIVQGLTEFLPISSNAHLRIVPALAGWPDPGAAFTAVVQLGTLAAVIVYFQRDLVRIAKATLLGKGDQASVAHDAQLGQMMVVGTIPIAIAGVLGKHWIETTLRSLYVVSTALIVLAVVLALAEYLYERRQKAGIPARPLSEAGWADAITVGLAQTLALIGGASRSGVTITAGLLLGLARDAAARFSFLLSLPAVFAAGVFELYGHRRELVGSSGNGWNLVLCTLVSAFVGYACIAFLLHYLRTRTMWVFVVYRIALGIAILTLLAQGRLAPDQGLPPGQPVSPAQAGQIGGSVSAPVHA